MKITVEDNSLQVAKNFEKQVREQPQIVKTALGRTAEFLMGIIKQRTQRGVNADGDAFPPYSTKPFFFNITPRSATPTYKTFQGGYKEYRSFMGKQSNKVDLNFFGNMLSNITQKSSPTEAIIYFANKFENTKAVGNQRKRKFFAIGQKEQRPIINVFMKEYNKLSKIK
jgi:hypothetical protein